MKPKGIYLALCVAGTALPYSQLIPFLMDRGLDVRLMLAQLFGTRMAAFFAFDVIVSSIVLWAFVWYDGRRRGVKRLWIPIVASLTVGVSLGLPLFLYMREVAASTTRAREANVSSRG